MNLFDVIQQWLETTIIKPITDRLARNEKDVEALAAELLKLQSSCNIERPVGDLSFLAQRIHVLEEKVAAHMLRVQKLENVSVDIDAVQRRIDDELEGDSFRDRLDDAVREQIQGSDSVREEIKDLCRDFLDNKLDDLRIEIKRG